MTPGAPLSEEARQAHLVEYEQCMESYRHTYATIWQAGALFAAISAAIVALGGSDSGATGFHVPAAIEVLAPLPFLFWWLGIFRPMNRYGELRNDRLAQIESLLNAGIPGCAMSHFSGFSTSRKAGYKLWRRVLTLQVLWRPRVYEVVNICGLTVGVVWIVASIGQALPRHNAQHPAPAANRVTTTGQLTPGPQSP